MTFNAPISFAGIKPTGDAVRFECGGQILVLVRTMASNVPFDMQAEITDGFTLRMFLYAHVDTGWERENLKFAYQEFIVHQSVVYFDPKVAIDALIGGLGLKYRAFLMEDERFTPAAPAPQFTADTLIGRPPVGADVAAMSIEERFVEALQRAPQFMDDAAADQFKALLEPATIAILVASLVAIAVVAATGVGGAIVLAVGWACVGWAIFDAAGHFYDFFTTINNASSDKDLDRAAQMLALAVVALGVGALMAFLTKGAARAATKGGKKVREAVEEAAERSRKRQTQPKGPVKSATEISVSEKLDKYLLNPDHPVGGAKAKWFDKALGFNQSNADALAKQIKFDPQTAVKTSTTEWGTKFNQIIPVKGANGKVIDVNFAWIKNNDGITKLVTAIPSKR